MEALEQTELTQIQPNRSRAFGLSKVFQEEKKIIVPWNDLIKEEIDFERQDTGREGQGTERGSMLSTSQAFIDIESLKRTNTDTTLKSSNSNIKVKSDHWRFGIYLRFLGNPGLTLYRMLVLITIFDSISIIYKALYLVPLFNIKAFDADLIPLQTASLDTILSLNVVHLMVQLVSFKLLLDMVWLNWYKNYSLASYISRMLMFVFNFLTLFWQKEDVNKNEYLHQTLYLFNYMWAFQMCYQIPALWVSLSVLYWTRVIVTKKGLLEVLYNLPTGSFTNVKKGTFQKTNEEIRGHLDPEQKLKKKLTETFQSIKTAGKTIQRARSHRNNFRAKAKAIIAATEDSFDIIPQQHNQV